MESPVVDEDRLRRGKDGAEETNNTAEVKDVSSQQSEQQISRKSVGTSLVDSLKSTVKSATGLLPASLGGSVNHGEEGGEGSTVSDEGKRSDVEMEASRLTVGDDPCRADEKVVEDLSLKGTTTDGTADEWSVVDPFPEEEEEAAGDQAQWEPQSISVQGEEESGDISAIAENQAAFQPQSDPHLGDPHLSVQARSFASSNVTAEPEIPEEDGYSIAYPSVYVAGGPSYVPPSSLGRGPHSFAKGDAHTSRVSETGDISAIAEDQAAFQPQSDPHLVHPHLSVQARGFAPSNVTAEPEIQEEDGDFIPYPSVYVAGGPFYVPSSSLGRRPRSFAKGDAHTSRVSETGDISAIAEDQAAFQPQSDPHLGNPHLSVQAGGFAPSNVTAGPEIQEEDGHSIASPSGYVAGSPSYVPSSSLRRRPRSSATGDAHISWVSETGDNSAIAEDEAVFQPQSDPLPTASVDTEVGSFKGFVSDVDNSNELTRKEPEFCSGYDPELEDDDNDASSVSTVSSRETSDGVDLWNRSPSQPEGGWDEVGSSSGLEGKGSKPETRQRREVYRMPVSDAEGEENGREFSPPLLVQPAGFIVRAVEFQLNLIVHVIAIGIWLVNFSLSTLYHPISRTVAVKHRMTNVTTGAATQVLEVLSFFGEGVSQAGPTIGKLSKKTFWGCLSVAYVICMLGLLLIPAFFVNIVIVNRVVDEPVKIRQALDFDFTQPKPVALLPLFPTNEIERIKSLPLEKVVKTRVFPVGNKFHVTVVLTLPESDYNMKLGMFQVTAETLSARDRVILRSTKPCRLRYVSFPVQLVNTLIYAVPNLFGLSKEAQTLEIRVLEAREKVIPTASVRILIEPKASVGGGVPEIYEAAIRLDSTLPWPKAILSSWKWLFFVWNGVCLFLFEVSIVLCCCRRVLIPSFGSKSVAEEEIVQGEVKDERATREVLKSSRSPRSNRRVYFEDGVPGAAGTQDRRGTRMLKNQDKADDPEGVVDDNDTPA